MRSIPALIIVVLALALALPQATIGQSGRNRPKIDPATKPEPKPPATVTPPVETVKDDPKNPPLTSTDPNDEVKLSATLVSVPLIVSDRGGRYLPDLNKKDFQLYEDGVEQKIEFVSSDEVPFNVALIIDTSGSTTDSGRDIRSAAINFVRQLHENDKVMVVSFASQVHFLTGFTSDRNELIETIQRITWGGDTKLYDAVYKTIKNEMKGLEGRKAIVLLTDGDDTDSKEYGYHDAIDAAVESGALVYVARYPSTDFSNPPYGGPGGPNGRGRTQGPYPWPGTTPPIILPPQQDPNSRRRNPNPNPKKKPFSNFDSGYEWVQGPTGPKTDRQLGKGDFLTDLVDQTGGDMFNATRYTDLQPMMHNIAEELRHVYVIGYYPTNTKTNGRFRRVNVRVVSDSNAVVRCKRGYNAPKSEFVAEH